MFAFLLLLSAALRSCVAFNLTEATMAAYFSAAAYCAPASVTSWSCQFCAHRPLTDVVYLYNASTETAGFVAFDAAAARVVVSFRGTVTSEEWIEDFDLRLVDPATGALCGANSSEVCVARGFYFDAYVSLRAQLVAALARFPASAPLVFTGHSLGAVVAEYAAWELGARRVQSVVTFGTPRGGNAAFAAAFAAARLPSAFRVTHAEDPVPHLPPVFFDYRHPPTEVYFPQQSNWSDWRICSAEDGEDPSCCDSVFPDLPSDHNIYMGIGIDSCS
jgi:pimeloyl-ACP methyl ester carboxylesterase